jgi:hypothetical protein
MYGLNRGTLFCLSRRARMRSRESILQTPDEFLMNFCVAYEKKRKKHKKIGWSIAVGDEPIRQA